MCPSTVVLVLLSEPIIRIFFERGEFGLYSTMITSSALSYYAMGAVKFRRDLILVSVFTPCGHQDARFGGGVCLTINATSNFILRFSTQGQWRRVVSAIAGTADFLILFYILINVWADLTRT